MFEAIDALAPCVCLVRDGEVMGGSSDCRVHGAGNGPRIAAAMAVAAHDLDRVLTQEKGDLVLPERQFLE